MPGANPRIRGVQALPGDAAQVAAVAEGVRGGEESRGGVSDIKHGWQEREKKLRETIRTCKHDGERRQSIECGEWFCAECGKMFPDWETVLDSLMDLDP